MDLDQIKQEAARLSPWAHFATVGPDGEPHVAPVHPAWDGDRLVTMTGTDSRKARNVAAGSGVCSHWQVGPDTGFDSLLVWGRGEVLDDDGTKRRLWEGIFDYDLSEFAPGGPDDSPGTGFLSVTPSRALLLRNYGMAGRETWSAG